MSLKEVLPCEYCLVLNPTGKKTCLACGAPLPKPVLIQPKITKVDSDQKTPLQDERQAAEKVDEVYQKAISVYATFWRALAESASIAMVSFSLGFVGGIIDEPVWGILTAALLGLAVGLTIKNYYATIISAPIGLAIGAALGCGGWVLGLRNETAILFIMSVFAVLAAVLGSMRYPFFLQNRWEKTRPVLGTLGGLVFGLLGKFAGSALRAATDLLLGQ